jgi:hypothetical protein
MAGFIVLKPGISNCSLNTPIPELCREFFVWAIYATACSHNDCGAHGVTRPANTSRERRLPAGHSEAEYRNSPARRRSSQSYAPASQRSQEFRPG